MCLRASGYIESYNAMDVGAVLNHEVGMSVSAKGSGFLQKISGRESKFSFSENALLVGSLI